MANFRNLKGGRPSNSKVRGVAINGIYYRANPVDKLNLDGKWVIDWRAEISDGSKVDFKAECDSREEARTFLQNLR